MPLSSPMAIVVRDPRGAKCSRPQVGSSASMEKLMRYLPIEDHGIIGDLHTAALVGTEGTIDWLCLPAFDSPSVFCSILDDQRGGHFSLRPVEYVHSHQLYLPDTNVLLTRFLSPQGVAEVLDFMPIEDGRETRATPRGVARD
jgi:GH15 family glucan-1,4-alpha-glucosidase